MIRQEQTCMVKTRMDLRLGVNTLHPAINTRNEVANDTGVVPSFPERVSATALNIKRSHVYAVSASGEHS